MPRHIEASITPELYNLLRDETKRRGLRIGRAIAELLEERLTLEEMPASLETLSTSAAPRTRRSSRSSSGNSAPTDATPDK